MSIYKDIPGYEGRYGVSIDGEVISYLHNTPKILKYRYDQCKYRRVALSDINMVRKDRSIHYVVITTWGEAKDPSKNLEINHKDGDKHNNHVTNLEWVTHKENMTHASVNGLVKNTRRGVDCHLTKITKEDVVLVRALWATGGYTQGQLALLVNTKRNNISEIVRRKSWRHIP